MAVNQVAVDFTVEHHTQELEFAGDHVHLSGQIDYPDYHPPSDGFPLLFILHHAGCNDRRWYWAFADVALQSGFAVFRWDKRGTGRSGAGGQGSTTQDAVNAYETAILQEHINRKQVIILAQDAGTGLLGSSYGLFARVLSPHALILVTNTQDADSVLAFNTHLRILMGEKDWNSWETYARNACEAHNASYKFSAGFHVVPGAERKLMQTQGNMPSLHPDARRTLANWLRELCPTSKLI